jgi:hypothetical protein
LRRGGSVTRRALLLAPVAAAVAAEAPVTVPVRVVIDKRPKFAAERLRYWQSIWDQAWGDFARIGVRLEASRVEGEIKRSPGDRPIFVGLDRAALNVVVTDHIPMLWDQGRALRGVAFRYEGYDTVLIALNYAARHQVPFFSINTCEHELLHVLLGDIFENHPGAVKEQFREYRIEAYGSRMWLFHVGRFVRDEARRYVAKRMNGDAGRR